MKEGWEKENIEKTKEVLKEHFKRKKEEEMFREVNLSSRLTQLHVGTDWEIDDSEFDEFNDDFIWKDLTETNNKKDKGSE